MLNNESTSPLHQPPSQQNILTELWRRRTLIIAIFSVIAIAAHLVLHFAVRSSDAVAHLPLFAVFIFGGIPLVFELLQKLWKLEFGSDLLAGISIVTSLLLGEYLAGAIVVLMLSGGEALESYALRSASSALAALAQRMPSIAHKKEGSTSIDIALDHVMVGDILEIYPHDICPVDGIVIEGQGTMDEAYLTGEPFKISKGPGSAVISGAINGEAALTIRADKRAADSRYAKIMGVMRDSEAKRPQLRRLGDKLGAFYTPLALAVALAAWIISGDAVRFLAVLVIATPCPLLIAIPVAIMGSISLCAKRAIIVKSPVVLEQISQCRTAFFDKTGTLTYGRPQLTEHHLAPGFNFHQILTLVASLERYSKHPLANAVLETAQAAGLSLHQAENVNEPPGKGLVGMVSGHEVRVTSRNKFIESGGVGAEQIPPVAGGLECVIIIDGHYAATLRFRDAPRADSRSFVAHLGPKHQFNKLMIISGDRESEVRYLADEVGITDIVAEQSPEEKLAIVRNETAKAKSLYVGDGINDAPAMMAATVGMAIGQSSDVTAEAAGVVIMDNTLRKVDEFMHISRHMISIALQSAVGGMILSIIGMLLAASGYLSPVNGAIAQEVIDVLAVLNALRAAFPPKVLVDL